MLSKEEQAKNKDIYFAGYFAGAVTGGMLGILYGVFCMAIAS